VKLVKGPVAQGSTFSFRVDDKLYTATAQASPATASALCFDLKSQMEADGRAVVVKDYGATKLPFAARDGLVDASAAPAANRRVEGRATRRWKTRRAV
jgi:hypothetical protein